MGYYGSRCTMREVPTIKVNPDSELALVIKHAVASGTALVVDTGDARYPLRPTVARRHAPARHSPTPAAIAQSKAGILAAAGSWKAVDTDAFKRYIRERRTTSSRPPVEL